MKAISRIENTSVNVNYLIDWWLDEAEQEIVEKFNLDRWDDVS